jgi:AraC-like DNA-binding protein
MVTKNERKILFTKNEILIRENEMFVINILQPHSMERQLPHDYAVISVTGLSECPVFRNHIHSSQCNQWFMKLLFAIKNGCNTDLSYCWDNLYNCLCYHQTTEKTFEDRYRIIEKAFDFIVENHINPITVNDIANHVGMSVFHFCRVFKSILGISVHRYLIQYRLSMSHKYLQNKMSVFDAAVDSGFYDSSHFVKTFYSYMALSPKAYQRAILGKQQEYTI